MYARIIDISRQLPAESISYDKLRLSRRRLRGSPLSRNAVYNVEDYYFNEEAGQFVIVTNNSVTSAHVFADAVELYTNIHDRVGSLVIMEEYLNSGKKVKKGDRVRINKWKYDSRLPIPSYGEVVEINKFNGSASVRLDEEFRGHFTWVFYDGDYSLEEKAKKNMKSVDVDEMLEIIHAEKPAEHILLDLEDFITN